VCVCACVVCLCVCVYMCACVVYASVVRVGSDIRLQAILESDPSCVFVCVCCMGVYVCVVCVSVTCV